MSRATALTGLVGAIGMTLLLSEVRWFNRMSVTDRLAPYQTGIRRSSRDGVLSIQSFREVIGPVSGRIGERLAGWCGVSEDLHTRLARIHSPLDVTAFRVRQLGFAAAGAVVGTVAAVVVSGGPALAVFLVVGTPMLTFVGLEQQLAASSADWKRRVFLELPVIAEQLAMLMSAGWSTGAAIGRVADRGHGACSRDLDRVRARVRQGLSDIDALREWAALADVDAVESLVSILALNRDTADLARLISNEARSIRREAQRELIETIETRTQQVWIPVTVAALIPGVLLMGVPFIDALSLFSP